MNSLSLSPAVNGGESCSFVSGSQINLRKTSLAADLQRGPYGRINGAWLKQLGQFTPTNWHRFSVFARVRKGQKHDYPWPDGIDPNLKSEHLGYLSHFKPLTEKPKPVTLPFEKPLVDLEKKIIDVRSLFSSCYIFDTLSILYFNCMFILGLSFGANMLT